MSAYESDQVATSFDRFATSYDAARRKMVPCFDKFYGWMVRVIPFERSASIRVLDLGAGTGLSAAWVLREFPNAQVRLVDIAEAMLKLARERFAEEKVTIEVLDYTSDALGGPYDAVVSALSIHHLPDEMKRALFKRVFGALAPGGIFVNAEQVLGPTPELEALYKQIWLDDARALGATEDDVAASLERMKQDRCASTEEQLMWMRELGFQNVDCWFKEARFSVYSGLRPR